jgi:homocysteine S-methyltransferase
MVLDGGLATELEKRGFDLEDPLWSAKVLLEAPGAIAEVHLDYLMAGADCITSSTYQATFQGLADRGLDRDEAAALLRLSVELALDARHRFEMGRSTGSGGAGSPPRPLVAAGIGPYGAFLADGSEYRGDYGLDVEALADFHRDRWHLLADCGADFLLCETVPSVVEADALTMLAGETPNTKYALSFSCSDGRTISDNTRVDDIEPQVFDHANLIGIGINCTSPRFVPSLLERFGARSDLPVIVYPNSGESWDSPNHRWTGTTHPGDFGTAAAEWRRSGASIIGGCCRTGPNHIASIAERVRQ